MSKTIILESVADLQAWRQDMSRAGRRIALVPTMGNLHEGHLSLVRLGRREADATVVSLFVNPTQFGPGEDYERYPRTFKADVEACRAEHVDVLFAPEAKEMYAADHSTYVNEEHLSAGLCGAERPGHFQGVCTVVAKLFHLVHPDRAVFGEKDFQQLRILQRMVRDLSFPVRIIPGPIIRESDGLAISSRNQYLSPGERQQAPSLYAALQEARQRRSEGEREALALCRRAKDKLSRAPNARLDYVAVVDDQTLAPLDTVETPARMLLAVRFGKTRLIDNLRLD